MTTDTTPTIRPRTPEDLPACAEALAAVHRHDGYPLDWPADPGGWLARASGLGAWVVELDGRLAGHVSLAPGGDGDLAPALWHTPATAVVSRLFVTPQARGHCLGTLLLDRAAAESRRLRLHPLLDVLTTDTAATALYEHLGWARLATTEQHWGPSRTVTIHSYAAPNPPEEPFHAFE
ncbi:GNAT family N-acetyltransferase [Streptomyces sp. NPDC004539]|uniref:GNAT family N-acetyltransferase n=1 Tax=Streptomyces sp. NPDC004539 TaxID=3154280 RepID=UPI00339E85D5